MSGHAKPVSLNASYYDMKKSRATISYLLTQVTMKAFLQLLGGVFESCSDTMHYVKFNRMGYFALSYLSFLLSELFSYAKPIYRAYQPMLIIKIHLRQVHVDLGD